MNKAFEILNDLRSTTSTKEKTKILEANKNNVSLVQVLKYAYDKVSYTYGVTPKTVETFETSESTDLTFSEVLEKLNNREVTGHRALGLCKAFLNSNSDDVNDLFLKIIDRDLKIGVNVKVFKEKIEWKKKD